MVKKSYRKIIEEELLPPYGESPDDEDLFQKMNAIVTLLNRCIHHTVVIPKGYYKCFKCGSKKVLIFDSEEWRDFDDSYEMTYFLDLCSMCKGKGYVDFVTNAMRLPNSQNEMELCITVPMDLLVKPKLEAASALFYNLYYTDFFYNIDAKFNPKAKHGKKTVKDFFEYFRKYKQKRDKRKIFLDETFSELRNQVLEISKVSDIPAGQIACKLCKGKPFDIEHNRYDDYIRVTMCGNCYGYGFQSKRDPKGFYYIPYDIDNRKFPEYDNKREAFKIILETVDYLRDYFNLELE